MKPVLLHDRSELAAFLGKHPQFNCYHLGDLDDFFWPYTSWYAHKQDGEIQAAILFYTGIHPPVLLAIDNHNLPQMQALANGIRPILPPKLYSHLSPGLEDCFQESYQLTHHGEHYKMVLTDHAKLEKIDTSLAVALTGKDLPELQELYAFSYPGNWFDARTLDTGQYMGIYTDKQLVSVAGVHVYSSQYRVAALGNITTHPDHRGQGLGTAVTAALCKRLMDTTDTIGLNVKTDNAPAIHTYRKLGFEVVATYHEWMVEKGS